jgi:hypothetical protein
MANTRIFNDDGRQSERLYQSIYTGNYFIDVPGNSTKPCYISDPYVRIQKFGANIRTYFTDVESQLRGVNRTLGKDCKQQQYKTFNVESDVIHFPTCHELTTDQPRATNPAWTVKDHEYFPNHFFPQNFLFLNPQENCAFNFQNNIATRIIEKDYFNSK